MRIGIDSHSISSGRGTGNRTYTSGIIRALIGSDHRSEYILYAIDNHPYYEQFHNNAHVQVRYISSLNGLIRNFFFLPRKIAKDSLNVVHLQFFLPLFIKCSSVLWVPDLYYLHSPHTSLIQKLSGRLTMWSIRRATHVITISEYSRQDIIETCSIDPRRITVVPLGVDKRFIPVRDPAKKQAVRQRLGLRNDYILYLGRTEDRRKNLPELVNAYAALRQQRNKIEQLVIAGRHGPGTETIHQQVSDLGLDNDVILPGFVEDEYLPALLSGAKLFIYVSSFEGFGLPVLEAMACGTPVITANTTSLPEVVGDAALLVAPGNIEELVKSMSRILTDVELQQRIGERGRVQAMRYSWEQAATKTITVFEKVAEKH